MKYSYQVFYRNSRIGTSGYMVVHTAAQADDEKARLERLGNVVTAIKPPDKEGYED